MTPHELETGYYWVRFTRASSFEVCHYIDKQFFYCGVDTPAYPYEIGDRIDQSASAKLQTAIGALTEIATNWNYKSEEAERARQALTELKQQ